VINFGWRVSSLVGTTLACVAPAVAAAQTPDPAAAGTQIEEVIVTAQKRAERLEDVPISITAMTGQMLEKTGVANIQDLGQISVGVQISHLATFIQPTIRGVTATLVTGGLSNNVAVYVDGFYQATPIGLNQDLVSVSRVQVLKGPQGTLFGRNTTGGAILIDSLDPDLDKFSGRVAASYGRFNERMGQVYVTGPIVPGKLAFDLAAYKRKSNGYLKDVGGLIPGGHVAKVDVETLRGKLLWAPTDDFRATLILEYNDYVDPANSTFQIYDRNLVAAEVPGTFYATKPWETSVNFPIGTRETWRTAGLKLEYDLGWATLKSFTHLHNETGHLDQDGDGTPVPRSRNISYAWFNYGTQEFNLAGTSDKLDWVLGAFAMKYLTRTNANVGGAVPAATPAAQGARFFSPGPTGDDYNKLRLESWAVFADGTYRITPRLAVIAGVRYSWDQNLINVPRPISSANPASSSYLPNPSLKAHFSAVTPRAVLRYELAENTNVYASYAKGFKSGGYGGGVPRNAQGQPGNYPLRPEKSTAYEVGLKTAQRNWRVSIAAYYNDYKDLQVSSTAIQIVNNLPVLFQLQQNAASSKIKGVEFEGSWTPVENLNLRAGVGYTHARYDKFNTAPQFVTCPAVVAGVPTLCLDSTTAPPTPVPAGYNSTTLVTGDVSGLQMLRAPDWTANAGFDYTLPTSIGEVVLNGSISYQTSFPQSDLSLLPGTRTYRYLHPSTTLINAQIAWTPWDKQLTLTLYGKNLTNEVTYNYYLGRSFGDSRIYGPPRTYGVRADYRF
jgi:iron complex outermembrane receptor protein